MAWYDITGTVADWVMAGSAVFAAMKANQWFSQRLHSKGLDKAEEILLSIDNSINELDNILFKVHESKYYLKAIASNRIAADSELLKTYDLVSDHLTDKFNHIIKIRQDTKLLERWNVTPKNIDLFEKIFLNFSDLFLSATQTTFLAHKCIYNICYMSRNDFDSAYAQYLDNYKKTDDGLRNVRMSYKDLIALDFNELFELKKPR